MTTYRPPLGGLFRLSGPAQQARNPEAHAEARSEARDAIRNFVRVLEQMDRETARPARSRPRTRREKA